MQEEGEMAGEIEWSGEPPSRRHNQHTSIAAAGVSPAKVCHGVAERLGVAGNAVANSPELRELRDVEPPPRRRRPHHRRRHNP